MFGPDFLVAPQLDQDATNRSVYLPPLPPPFVWQNVFNTAEQHNSTAGGMHLVVQTPLDTFPLFFRLKTVPGMRPAPPPPPPLPPPACDPSCRQAPTPHSDTVSGTNIAHANASTFHACCLMCTAHVGCGSFVFGLFRQSQPASAGNPLTCFLLGAPNGIRDQAGRSYGCIKHR